MKFTFETSSIKQQTTTSSKPSTGFKLKFSSVGAVVSTSPSGIRTTSRVPLSNISNNASQANTTTITCSSSSSAQTKSETAAAPLMLVQDTKHTLQTTVKRKVISPYKSKQTKAIERESQKLHNVPQPPAKKSLSGSLETLMPERSAQDQSSPTKEENLQTKEELGTQRTTSPVIQHSITSTAKSSAVDRPHSPDFENLEGVECISAIMDGMIFAILGRKFKTGRAEIVRLILTHGGKVSEKVTAKVTHLLCMGDEDSAKYKKAVQRGIPVLNEEDVFCIVKEGQDYIKTIDTTRLYPRGIMRTSSPFSESDSDNNNSPNSNNTSKEDQTPHSPCINALPIHQSLQKRKNTIQNNNTHTSKSEAAPLESLMKVVDTELTASEASCAALLLSLANAVASVKVEN